MKKLQYSPDAIEKLHEIKQNISARYDPEKAKAEIREMTEEFRDLQQFENKGSSVENLIGIPCDYRMLYVQHNYAFYRIEENTVRITDIHIPETKLSSETAHALEMHADKTVCTKLTCPQQKNIFPEL